MVELSIILHGYVEGIKIPRLPVPFGIHHDPAVTPSSSEVHKAEWQNATVFAPVLAVACVSGPSLGAVGLDFLGCGVWMMKE